MNIRKEIDKLGELKEQIKKLEDKASTIIDALKAVKLVTGEYYGDEYILSVVEKTEAILSAAKVEKALHNKANFLKVVKVVKSSLGEYLSLQEIDKCVEDYKKSVAYLVRRLK